MDWKIFWEKKGLETGTLNEVARVNNQNLITQTQIQLQAQQVIDNLQLNPTQQLLDVCCGNGYFSAMLAKQVQQVVAIDFSTSLLTKAKQAYPHIIFKQADAIQLPQWLEYNQYIGKFDVITICFSFQYFDSVEKGKTVIKNLEPLLKNGGKILLTDVPDSARFFKYYNSMGSLLRLIKQMIKNQNLMGKFWAEHELDFICRQTGLKGYKITQPSALPYGHYRMDYLMVKP